jgi:DNA-binding MarR family transcriptional regulator
MQQKDIFNPQTQIDSIESKIVVSLERLSEAFRVLLWQEAKGSNLSPIQIQILIFLRFHTPDKCKISFLATEFNMTKATISDAVKVLEQKSLVRRITDAADNRSHFLQLTDAGINSATHMAQFALPIADSVGKLTDTEKAFFLEKLMKTIENLQKIGIISLQRMCFNCQFYQNTPEGHFCNLLQKHLAKTELRVDCPEFLLDAANNVT